MILKPFANQPNLLAFFGDSQLEYNEMLAKNELVNDGLTLKGESIVVMEQPHSNKVVAIDDMSTFQRIDGVASPLFIPEADAILTDLKGVYLCTRTADCVPLLIYDQVKGVVGVVHSGRDSTRLNIMSVVLNTMREHYSSDLNDIQIAIGPSISKMRFNISDDIFDKFVEDTGIPQKRPYLDLNGVVIEQILDFGISPMNIIDFPLCTFDSQEYHSYRRDKTALRQVSIIGIHNE